MRKTTHYPELTITRIVEDESPDSFVVNGRLGTAHVNTEDGMWVISYNSTREQRFDRDSAIVFAIFVASNALSKPVVLA